MSTSEAGNDPLAAAQEDVERYRTLAKTHSKEYLPALAVLGRVQDVLEKTVGMG